MKILQSNIGGCGAPYQVLDEAEDNVYKSGTLGLLSYVKGRDMDYPNVVYFHVITVRRGKGGKKRLDFNEISFPIFSTPNMVELSKDKELMPPLDRRYYVLTTPLPKVFTHAYEMDGYDFLSWGCCHAKYLSQLRRSTSGFRMWPKDNKHIMNVMSSMNDYMGSSHNEEQHQNTFDRYTDTPRREDFVRKMRKISSGLVQSHINYKLKIAKMEYNAISFICGNIKKFGVDKGVAEATKKQYNVKYEKISHLRDSQRRNKGKANMG